MPSYTTMYNTTQTSSLQWQPTNTAGLFMDGTDASETMYGSAYNDVINGMGGNDTLYGQNGDDAIYGGLGNDILHGGNGADVLDGGAGVDTASYTGSAAVTVDLKDRGFGGQAEGDTYRNIENVFGSSFADVLIGNAGANTLGGGTGNDQCFGDFGNDTLNGDAGRDHLEGGFGNDILNGGTGYDTLRGGEGSDTFILALHEGGDTILDFQLGIDKIALDVGRSEDSFHAPFGDNGQLARGYFRSDGTFSGTGLDSSDEVIYLTDTNQLVSVNELTSLNGHWTLHGTHLATLNVDVSHTDFLLV